MAAFGYDKGAAAKAREEYTLMPEGEYLAVITESSVKDTRNNNGKILKLTYEILAPTEFKNRKVWQSINVQNSSAKAEEIGQEELARVREACGIPQGQLADTLQLHNKPHGIKLKIELGNDRPEGGKYPDKNVVWTNFAASAAGAVSAAPTSGAVAPALAQQPVAATAPAVLPSGETAAQQTPAPAANSAPWLKRG
jgi:hypothetical protein